MAFLALSLKSYRGVVPGFVGVVLTWHALGAAGFSEPGTEAGKCEFDNDPVGVGFFWDPTCKLGMLGCNADGRNIECRLCGAGDELSVKCPASSCKFPNEPFVSYYWDNECELGKLGCWADGINAQCRFCGDYPHTSVPCPEGAARPNSAACTFEEETDIPHYWEPGCVMGKHGCKADGVNVQCRYCGGGDFADIPCPAEQVCEFANRPTVPFFWDPTCADNMGLGCKADGIHAECRFCGQRPFEGVPCPEEVAPPENMCVWPLHGEPPIISFWDPDCEMGKLGCWADGLHAQCRFCGAGIFQDVDCPSDETIVAGAAAQRKSVANLGEVDMSGAQDARGHHAVDMLAKTAEIEPDMVGGALSLALSFGVIASVLLVL